MPAIKPHIQSVLRRVGLHQRLKASLVYDLYWWIADKRRIEGRSREVDFYRSLLVGFRKGDLILDVGANGGEKTDIFLRLGARVLAVEPDDANQELLRDKFLRHRLVPKPVVVVGKALSDRDAVETMWIDGPGSALNTFSQKWVQTLRGDKSRFQNGIDVLEFGRQKEVETTTLEHLIAAHGMPFFVKIDVEGYEMRVIQGLQRPVPYLSFEVNLPEFRPEGLQCIELLGRLAADGEFNYAADCQQGLALPAWLPLQEFSRVLQGCGEGCIEVFWKTPASRDTSLP